jgi:DNA ligase D-like protein (predicted polymerase)
MARADSEKLLVDGHEVTITNPGKVVFPDPGITKRDLVAYYLAVAAGALLGVHDRPMALKRFVNGVDQEPFFQKRAPKSVPPFVRTAELVYPSGRTADEVVVDNAAALAWVVNLGCVDLNPHPVRAGDLERPDELRIDLDPGPGVPWDDVRRVALVVQEALSERGYTGWPKTSGSRGMHIYVRIEPRWTFADVRRAALALARDVERRAPSLATSKWWKEERHGVFVDYNQNARDHTVASAYSVRPRAGAPVSAPITWDEVPAVEIDDFNVRTVPPRFASLGDVGGGIDDRAYPLDALLELADRLQVQAADGPRGRRAQRPPDPRPVPDPTSPSGRAGSVPPGRASATVRNTDGTVSPTGRRRSSQPLLVISQAADRADALAGLDRWRARHPQAAAHVRDPEDVLVDAMRGRYTVWWRVRVNLRNVPEELRPPAEPPDPDYDPLAEFRQTRP